MGPGLGLFRSGRGGCAALRLGVRLCKPCAGPAGPEPRLGRRPGDLRAPGSRCGLFAVGRLPSAARMLFSPAGGFVTINKMKVLTSALTRLICVRKFGSFVSVFWNRF